MLVLFDSRARKHTGRRLAYEFPETTQGLHDAWERVIRDEVPDEYDHYIGFARVPLREGPELFNDYWAIYGWYLNTFEDDMAYAADVDLPFIIQE